MQHAQDFYQHGVARCVGNQLVELSIAFHHPGHVALAPSAFGQRALSGKIVADFARRHKLKQRSVYGVLYGNNKGRRGEAHRAAVALQANPADAAWLAPFADELRFLFISGDVSVRAVGEAGTIGVAALPTQKPKCVRCWHHRADVGSDPRHPALCARCVSNIEGPGEDRRWF